MHITLARPPIHRKAALQMLPLLETYPLVLQYSNSNMVLAKRKNGLLP
jgi:hypothetical protein